MQAFGALSAVSALWCVVWICIYKSADSPLTSQLSDLKSAPSAASILSLTIVGATVAAFAAYWLSALLFIWLPAYLETVYALTTSSAGLILTVAWIVQVPLYPLVGSLSQLLQRRGYSTQVARVTLATIGLAVAGAAMVAMTAAGSLPAAIALATLCLGATVVVITLIPPVVAKLCRKRAEASLWADALHSVHSAGLPRRSSWAESLMPPLFPRTDTVRVSWHPAYCSCY